MLYDWYQHHTDTGPDHTGPVSVCISTFSSISDNCYSVCENKPFYHSELPGQPDTSYIGLCWAVTALFTSLHGLQSWSDSLSM